MKWKQAGGGSASGPGETAWCGRPRTQGELLGMLRERPTAPRPGAQALGKIGCRGGAENWAADLNGKGRLKTQLFSSAVPLWVDASEFAVAGEEGCPSDEWNIVGVQQTFPERID